MSDHVEIKIDPAVNHTAVKVKDLKTSVRFYHEVMGLPVVRQLGSPDNPRVVFLPGVELSKREEDGDETPGFFGHIGLAVDNIEEMCRHLEEQGVEFDVPLKEIVFEEIGERLKLAFFKDPDGITVEFVQWRPL